MAIRFDDIGNRLKAFRRGSGLSADEIARRIGISRTALYRFEKGEVVKIETLEKLSELLDVSVPTLLGVGVEYVPTAVSFFERVRQIEAASEHIIVLAGPVSYVVASDAFDDTLAEVLVESIPEDFPDRSRALAQVVELMEILRQRKVAYRARVPGVLNLISEPKLPASCATAWSGGSTCRAMFSIIAAGSPLTRPSISPRSWKTNPSGCKLA